MFKKTLMAAALTAATASTAFAGDITVTGTAYKVGNEYLAAYTGTALEGNLETASIGITYKAGIALGVNNTLKFTVTGGAIKADTGLKLQAFTKSNADIQAEIAAAVNAVVAGGVSDAADLAAMELAATTVTAAAAAADGSIDISDTDTAIATAVFGADFAATQAVVIALAAGAPVTDIYADAADLIDFETDANNNYVWMLFKITAGAGVGVNQSLSFNDSDSDGSTDAIAAFTKATIGAGDLTIGVTEAKDDTGSDLTAPIATAKTLVTTADQFAITTVEVKDTIDVEQARKFFSDAPSDALSTSFVIDVTNDGSIDLGIDADAALFTTEVTGSLTGVASISMLEDQAGDATNDDGAFTGSEFSGDGINDQTIAITVDGVTDLATRKLGVTLLINPIEATTDDFYLVGSDTASVAAFNWVLNGSEITFPYAPIGHSNITTNFELANSGDQDGEIFLSAFGRDGATWNGTVAFDALKGELTKISQADIMTALSITEGTSMSLTITTTAPAGDIKVTGYSNVTTGLGGRMTLLSDAYETAIVVGGESQ